MMKIWFSCWPRANLRFARKFAGVTNVRNGCRGKGSVQFQWAHNLYSESQMYDYVVLVRVWCVFGVTNVMSITNYACCLRSGDRAAWLQLSRVCSLE